MPDPPFSLALGNSERGVSHWATLPEGEALAGSQGKVSLHRGRGTKPSGQQGTASEGSSKLAGPTRAEEAS